MAHDNGSQRLTEHGALNHVPIYRSRPVRIALYYAIGGLIWVAVSERVLSLMPAHSYALNRLMFVGVNALLLYLVAARYMKTIRISVAAREEALVRARGVLRIVGRGNYLGRQQRHDSPAQSCGQEMFGYHEMELVGQPIEVLVPQRFHYRHEAHRTAYFTAPKSRKMGRGMEIAGRRKDGSEFPVEISLNVVHIHRGKLVIAFITDITERRAMEREARRNETVDALAAVAAGIAHELNNPLAVMASRIELMLASDQDLSVQTRDDLLVLQKNIERASRISHNMLSLARQRPGARQALDMNVAVEEAMLIVGAEAKLGVLRYETRPRPLAAAGDGRADRHRAGADQLYSERARCGRAPDPNRNRAGAGTGRQSTVIDFGRRRGNRKGRARQTLPAVLHDQGEGDRPRPLAEPADHPGSRRQRNGRVDPGPGHYFRDNAADHGGLIHGTREAAGARRISGAVANRRRPQQPVRPLAYFNTMPGQSENSDRGRRARSRRRLRAPAGARRPRLHRSVDCLTRRFK